MYPVPIIVAVAVAAAIVPAIMLTKFRPFHNNEKQQTANMVGMQRLVVLEFQNACMNCCTSRISLIIMTHSQVDTALA